MQKINFFEIKEYIDSNQHSYTKNWRGIKYLLFLKQEYRLNYWTKQYSSLFVLSESEEEFLCESLEQDKRINLAMKFESSLKLIRKDKKFAYLAYEFDKKKYECKITKSEYKKLGSRFLTFRFLIKNMDVFLVDAEKSPIQLFWHLYYQSIIETRDKYKSFKKDRSYTRLNYLKNVFNLTEDELTIVKYFVISSFARLSHRKEEDFRSINIDLITKNIMECCNLSRQKTLRALREKGSLQRLGIISISNLRKIVVNQIIINYILGVGEENLIDTFVRKDKLEDTLPTSLLLQNSNETKIIKNFIKQRRGINILLYGAPGTGKTSLAKSLGKEMGKDVYFVNELSQRDEEDASSRKIFIRTADHVLDPKKSIIVIDEADQILNTVMSYLTYGTAVDKSWINQFLTENKVPIIWITNETNNIEESTLRRFSYSVEFKPKTKNELAKVWKSQINDLGIKSLELDDIEYLANNYNVSAGAISLAAKNLKLNRKKTNKEKIRKELDIVLSAHQKLIGKENSSDLNSISHLYSIEHVNANYDLKELTSKIARFEKNKGKQNSLLNNINMLLSGPPGCGKSEFVKYLSLTLNKELILKRSSDILSMWVGGSEANIKKAFLEANEKNSILFIDECDSLLQGRESASRSFEVSRVNEILTWLENHKTICIMATNFIDNCDQAMMRRFGFKVKLDYLKPEGNLYFYRKMLAELSKSELSAEEINQLMGLKNLTPGDFKSVYQGFAFENRVQHSQMIEALSDEVRYKKAVKSIGLK